MPRTQPLLNPSQKDRIASLIADGLTLREAAVQCLELWGIQISHVTLHGYDEIKKAIQLRDRVRTAETKENLDKAVTPVVNSMIKNLSETSKEIEALKKHQETLNPGEKAYFDVSKEIRQLRKVHNELMKTFNTLVAQSQNMNQTAVDDLTNERDRKRRLDDLIREKGLAGILNTTVAEA